MELIRKEDKRLIMTQYVGTATEKLESGEEVTYELNTTINLSPIIHFPNGNQVIFTWEDIIKLAKEYNRVNQEDNQSEKITFNTNEDMLFQIAMMSFDKYNNRIATMNDHLGEEVSYQDVEGAKNAQINYEKELLEKAVKQLQQENTNLKQALIDIRKYINETCYAFNYDGSHCSLKDSEHSKRILQIIDKAIGDDNCENPSN